MSNKFRYIIYLWIFALISSGYSDVWNKNRKGINAYKNQKYDEAIKHFKSALEEAPNDDRLYYNLGTAYLQKKDTANAEKFLKRSLQTRDLSLKEKAFSNLGDLYYQARKFDQALKSYREALKINPGNTETKKKFELALKKQKQQQKQKQQNKQNQKKNNQQQQKKQDQQNKQDQNQQQSQKQNQQQQQQNQQKIDKKTAEQILKALRQKEKENQKKARKAKGSRVKVKKDW